MEEKSTYLMLRRDLIFKPDMDFTEQQALIIYTILFNGPIIASDSDLIVNPQLRYAILHNKFVTSLVDSGYIQFAIRSENGVLKPLSETASTIFKNKGHNPLIPAGGHGKCHEFHFIENHGTILEYSLNDAAERYQREALKILYKISQTKDYAMWSQLDPDLARLVLQATKIYLEGGRKLTWSFFKPSSSLWNLIHQLSPEFKVSNSAKLFISNAMRGPYATFLPETLKVSPTYSKEDSLGIDMYRGRYLQNKETLVRKTLNRARISLVDYVTGLNSLSLNDIQKLRQSDERVAYDNACLKFSRTLADIDEPVRALYEYRRRIDSKILQRLRKRANVEDTENIEVSIIGGKIHKFQETELGQWIKFSVVTAADQFTCGAVSIADFLYTRLQQRQQKNAEKEAHERNEIEKEIAIQQFQQEGSPILEGQAIIDEIDIRDFCTDVA